MAKKIAPLLVVIAFFVLIAFLTMIYGFSRSASFQKEIQPTEKSAEAYTLPHIVPSVWIADH